ncbi:MAG: VWA domain-containing protein [Bacteroidota bacterium]
MKTLAMFAYAAALLFGHRTPVQAHEPGEPILLSGRVNCPLVPFMGGTVFLQISISPPTFDVPRKKPMNLSIVLDRSGSMADERKIHYAKSALLSLVDRLSPDDLLSIVMYDDIVEVLRPPGRVRDKREIHRLVEQIFPRGSTNLGGGMVKGLEQVAATASREFVNRVVLLSDGLANQGITDPHALNKIARRYRSQSISLTTIGVGLDYNENLMVGLAEYGGGNYYFIESPHSIAHILRREFDAMTTILAQNSTLELTFGTGVQIADVIGYPWTTEGNRCSISLGDLAAGHTQEVTVELRIPAGSGTLALARGSLRYETDNSSLQSPKPFDISVEYSRNLEAVEERRNLDAQAKADIAVSTRTVEKAMEALDSGNEEQALQELESAGTFLRSSPAAESPESGGILLDQLGRLDAFKKALKDSSGDHRRAKKSIQYDNYRIQKNNQ